MSQANLGSFLMWIAAELPPDIPPACVQRAAQAYDVPIPAVLAMLRQEKGEVGREYPRKGRVYYGPAQISDLWLPHFKPFGWSAAALRDNACVNVIAGTYILAYYFVREKDWFRAFARYNVGRLDTPYRVDAGYRYAQKVLGHWSAIHQRWGAK